MRRFLTQVKSSWELPRGNGLMASTPSLSIRLRNVPSMKFKRSGATDTASRPRKNSWLMSLTYSITPFMMWTNRGSVLKTVLLIMISSCLTGTTHSSSKGWSMVFSWSDSRWWGHRACQDLRSTRKVRPPAMSTFSKISSFRLRILIFIRSVLSNQLRKGILCLRNNQKLSYNF